MSSENTTEYPEESTALEIEQDDDNIEQIHERRTLLSNTKKKIKSPSCQTLLFKAVIILIACILFILMMVEMWGEYGDVITTKSFRPTLVSMAEHCITDSTETPQFSKYYNAPSCTDKVKLVDGKNVTIFHCDFALPTNPYILLDEHDYMLTFPKENHFKVQWNGVLDQCVRMQIWSI